MSSFVYGRMAHEGTNCSSVHEYDHKIRHADTEGDAMRRCKELARGEGVPIKEWVWSTVTNKRIGIIGTGRACLLAEGLYVQEAGFSPRN